VLQTDIQNRLDSAKSSICERLGVSPGYASKYRERLLVAGLVKATGWPAFVRSFNI